MNGAILGVDAALDGFSCAILDGERLLVRTVPGKAALEGGLQAVDALLSDAGLSLGALGGVAVGLGPGSFTGVRIALAYAKSLALGAGLPIRGISSYDLLEPEHCAPPMLTLVVGRPGVVCARLRLAGDELRICGKIDEVVGAIAAEVSGALGVLGATEDVLAALGERGIVTRIVPSREVVAAVALVRIASAEGRADDVHALAPDYGEAPATTPPRSQR